MIGTQPKVSVVMPVRNGEAYLELAVASIVAQTMPDWELIAIDDRSTDATMAILQRFAAVDARIKAMPATGAGIVAALNQGIAASRAALIARMDGDDIAMPDRLERQIELMAGRPELVAAGSAALTIDDAGNQTGVIAAPTDAASISAELLRRNPFIHPTMIIRKNALIAAGGYRSGCTYAEDYDLWLRLEELGGLTNLAQPTLLFRVHAGQTSQTKRLAQRAATALARQAALRRRGGRGEGVDMANALPECCVEYLSTRAEEPALFNDTDAKDISVLLRYVHLQLPRRTALQLLKRLDSETAGASTWLLRTRLAWARVVNIALSLREKKGSAA